MNSEKRLKHIIQKYPQILLSLSTQINKTHPKYPSSTILTQPLQSNHSKSSKLSVRRPSRRLLRIVLTCTVCKRLYRSPVTLNCGDTVCRDCVVNMSSINKIHKDIDRIESVECPRCNKTMGVENGRIKCNVLLNQVLELIQGEQDTDSCKKATHEYQLRNRNVNVYKEERPLATVKRKNMSSETVANSQLPDTIACCDREGTLSSSLDCTLCRRILFEPITTSCGHTFCRGCVARVLDYGLACPLCMGPLATSVVADTGTTRALEHLVQCLRPREYEERMQAVKKEIEMNDDENQQMPVFICISAFPGVACPLYVSEPRYRLLTRRCLQSSRRRFAMAAPAVTTSSSSAATPAGNELEETERFAAYGTVLEVRDAVYLKDGTSILTTVGVRRFKVIARGEKDGYDTARISYISDTPVTSLNLPSLTTLHDDVYLKALRWVHSLSPAVQAEITRSLGEFPPLETNWTTLPDGPAWAWWLLPVLPLSTRLQVGFLSTTSLEKRLRAIDKLLERMEVRMKEDVEVRVVSEEETCRRVEYEQQMEF